MRLEDPPRNGREYQPYIVTEVVIDPADFPDDPATVPERETPAPESSPESDPAQEETATVEEFGSSEVNPAEADSVSVESAEPTTEINSFPHATSTEPAVDSATEHQDGTTSPPGDESERSSSSVSEKPKRRRGRRGRRGRKRSSDGETK